MMVIALAAVAGIVVYFAITIQSRSTSATPPSASVSEQVVVPQPVMPTESVPQALPVWMSIQGVLAQTDLNPAGIKAVNGEIIPVDNRPVFSLNSNEPGTNSPGTTFIYGHNYTDSSGAFVPFSTLEEVKPGDVINLGTTNGVLHYSVLQTFTVPKDVLPTRSDIFQNVPNRLILITCDTVNGNDTYNNRIVIARLAT